MLVYATARPDAVHAAQEKLGIVRASKLIETSLAEVARRLVEGGVTRVIVAGGETAGAVVAALEVEHLRIGAMISSGVPWTQVVDRPLQLALKSGNFGSAHFFIDAIDGPP